MKRIKRGLAAAMAAMLMVPSQTVWAAPLPEGQVNAGTSAETPESSPVKKATASSADKEVHTSGKKTAAIPKAPGLPRSKTGKASSKTWWNALKVVI